MRVARQQEINAAPDSVRQLDPELVGRQWRRNRDDRRGKRLAAGLLNEQNRRPDHQVPIGRRDDAVLELNETNG